MMNIYEVTYADDRRYVVEPLSFIIGRSYTEKF